MIFEPDYEGYLKVNDKKFSFKAKTELNYDFHIQETYSYELENSHYYTDITFNIINLQKGNKIEVTYSEKLNKEDMILIFEDFINHNNLNREELEFEIINYIEKIRTKTTYNEFFSNKNRIIKLNKII